MDNSKYNILHVIDKYSMDGINPSSCAYLIRDWFRYSDKSRFNVMTCGLKKEEPAGEIYKQEGMRVFFLGNGKYSVGNVTGLIKLVDREKIDLLHLHGYSSANFGRIAAREKGIPNIVHEHAILKILPHQYLADFLLRKMTDSAIGVSGAVKEFLSKGRHVPAELIKIVYNGVNLEKFQKCGQETLANLRREFSLQKDNIIIGALTRLREEKGNEYLIRAMPAVIEKYPAVRLLIAGDGPLKEKLESLVRELGLEKHVYLIGFRTDVLDLLTLFDIVVIPSLNEGFGLVMVEAMAMEKPIVATKVGGLIEIAGGTDSAVFVRPGNSRELSDGLISMITDPEKAKKMAQIGLQESARFSIQKNVEKLEELYVHMLGNGK
ncbi:glycosyltransferase [candidate division KSB1 bacterium]|nr:glycosyltransferase [candidate division KSB1 bacterium]